MELLELEKARQSLVEEESEAAEPLEEQPEAETPLESVDSATENPESAVDNDVEASTKKRKRKSKKNKRRAALLADERDPYSLEDGYDPTLLAVVGVLDEIKSQDNVAAWIHSGGLWGPPELKLQEQYSSEEMKSTDEEVNPDVDDAEVSDGSNLSVDGGDERKEKRRRRKEISQNEAPQDPPTQSSGHVGEGTGANQELTDETAATTSTPPTMWFEHMTTLLYWAKRGKDVLEQMEIPIEHGIER